VTPEKRPDVAEVVPLALRLPPLDDDDAHHGRLLVKVLGSVDFVGSKSPLDRPQSRELVVYLALHPAGVDEGRLKTALWPDRAPQGGAFNEAVSRARRCLGLAADGSHHLPHVRDGIYRLGDGAATDFTLLERAYRRVRISASEDTVGEVAEALALVRGLPFEGSRGYEWAHAEGFVSRMEGLVADAAGLVAEWSLGCEDHETAIWATRQGVKAAMADERLYQLRMRAHAAAGDHAGLEATIDELCAVLEIADPSAGLLPETMALYDSLRRPKRRVASG
jgi:DNA-binding SARP family transcriptional activator